jgi:acyl carrier protein
MAHATYTPTEVAATVDHIVNDVLAVYMPLTPEMTITGDLRADSMAMTEIAMGIEEFFPILVNDSDLDNIATVGDLHALAIALLRDQGCIVGGAA